ncbi:MAG: flagellar hook-length control protein FliK [Lachnospiraceae bacterium]|nr:flagellar hook-length control protein FliK [Lachnospiraceae bacterium]
MGESRIAGIGTRMVAQAPTIDIPERQGKAEEVMFADMISMNGSTDIDNFAADVTDEMLGTVETHELDTRREKPADAYEKYQYKDKTIRTGTSDKELKNVEEAVAEVKEFEEAVTEVVAEELHVSKEELEAAMEALGLNFLDLLDKGNLANLVAKLTGSENINQLLCNEAFTNVLQQVNELGEELLADVQMTPEELMEFGKVFEQQMAADAMTPVNQGVEKADVENAVETVADDMNPVQDVKSEVTDVENTEVTEDGVKVEVIRVDALEGKQQGTSEEELSDKEQEFAGKAGKQAVQVHSAQANENVVVNHTQNATFTEQIGNFETVQTLPPHVTVADIMEQFAEHVRISVATDTTKMEMQLNPENLGKLYVEVIENDGSITAKIQTQNAVVKEALEMQIADLKVNLNQAGVKVDSVEVTIASHEFERNLEQDANSKKQQDDAEPKATRHRNINLNGLDELSGLMTEEETLVAKMMAEQGNSVDFTA